jgi:hypothetical protein
MRFGSKPSSAIGRGYRWHGARFRGFAAAVAVLFVASGLARFVHMATTAHTRCLEHGALVHISQAGSAVAGRVIAVSSSSFVPTDARSADDGHRHCELCPWSREQADSSPDVIAEPSHVGVCFSLPFYRAEAPTRVAVYRLAPKNSPPV